ncbi:protein stunted-like [Anticarsia gemmatalis]|uniref:protein stunted-like n=1 Tax=Anticarsia gemmatalis TaxID=129554 RepID=UPI003F773BCA
MSTSWRMAGLNYVNYSNIAARVLRGSLKAGHKEEAMKRGAPHMKYYYWANGEMLPLGQKLTVEKEVKVATA